MHALIKFFSYWNIPYISIAIIYFLFVTTAKEKVLIILTFIMALLVVAAPILICFFDFSNLSCAVGLVLSVLSFFSILMIIYSFKINDRL